MRISLSGIGGKLEELARQELEKRLVEVIVDSQWAAVEETLRREFAEPNLETALKAGRRACERMVEHLL